MIGHRTRRNVVEVRQKRVNATCLVKETVPSVNAVQHAVSTVDC